MDSLESSSVDSSSLESVENDVIDFCDSLESPSVENDLNDF